MKYFFTLLFLAGILSCDDNSSSGSNADDDTTNAESNGNSTNTPNLPEVTGCYMRTFKQDTLVAHLQQEGKRIFGRLSFDNYQKDGSSGKVEGVLEDNIIKLQYAFHSEGMYSVMDVYFKLSGDSLIRGIGTMDTRGDTAFYADPARIEYVGSALKKLPCESVDEKYKGF